MFTANDGESVFECGDPIGSDGEGDEALIRACDRVARLVNEMIGNNSDVDDWSSLWMRAMVVLLESQPITMEGFVARKRAIAMSLKIFPDYTVASA